MSKKNKPGNSGIVYSTDPGFRQEIKNEEEPTPAPPGQKLKVKPDSKQRAGKTVTLITGFTGNAGDLEELGKKLKTYCGTGGSVKEGEIIIQGDQRDKVMQWLLKNGYKQAKLI